MGNVCVFLVMHHTLLSGGYDNQRTAEILNVILCGVFCLNFKA